MKSLRFYALAFTFSVTFCGLNAAPARAQSQTTTPQIAKNQTVERTNPGNEENTPKTEEKQPAYLFSAHEREINAHRRSKFANDASHSERSHPESARK